jgi:hypothetical protein
VSVDWGTVNVCDEPATADGLFSWAAGAEMLGAAWSCPACGGIHARVFDLNYVTERKP